MHWAWEDRLLEDGHRAGLAAIGRDRLPEAAALAAHFHEAYLPFLWVPGAVDELEYPGLVRELFAHFDVELTDDELADFLEAEHDAWNPAPQLGSTTHALLDSLRARGLKLGLVSNAFDSGELQHRDLERMGLAERLDAAVFSSELGKRKPDASIFQHVLRELDVEPTAALFVGDDLIADLGRAKRVGMGTVQALWFRADARDDGPEPDHRAFTEMDVLNIVRRLTGEA